MAKEINKSLSALIEVLPEEQVEILFNAMTQHGAASVIETIKKDFGGGETSEELPIEQPLEEVPVGETSEETPVIDEPMPDEEVVEESMVEEEVKPKGETLKFTLGNEQESKYDMFDEAESTGRSPMVEDKD